MIVEYVRDQNYKPIGVAVAIDPDHIGWSQCHFDRPKRLTKAQRRAAREARKTAELAGLPVPPAPPRRGDDWDKEEAKERAFDRAKNARPISPFIYDRLDTKGKTQYVLDSIDPTKQPTQKFKAAFVRKLQRVYNRALNEQRRVESARQLRDTIQVHINAVRAQNA